MPSAAQIFNTGPSDIQALRKNGMGMMYETTAALLLTILFTIQSVFSLKNQKHLLSPGLRLIIWISIGLVFVQFFYQPDKLTSIFLASMILMSTDFEISFSKKEIRFIVASIILILIVACAIAVLELVLNASYARYRDYTGVRVMRPSSIFFNPNLFGFWAAFFALVLMALDNYSIRPHMTRIALALCGIAIFLCSSRGFMVLSLLILVIASSIGCASKTKPFEAFSVLALTLVGCMAVSICLALYNPGPVTASLGGLCRRLYMLPLELFRLVFGVVVGGEEVEVILEGSSKEFRKSYVGRFGSAPHDSGVRLIFESGLLRTSGFFVAYIACLVGVFKVSYSRFKLTLICTAFFVGCYVLVRPTIFPVWCLLALSIPALRSIKIRDEGVT